MKTLGLRAPWRGERLDSGFWILPNMARICLFSVIDERAPLPQSVARRRVDGGAPYMNCAGAPSYSPDRFDTRLTHPLAPHTALADAEAMVLRDFHRRWRRVEMSTMAFDNAKAMALRDLHRRWHASIAAGTA